MVKRFPIVCIGGSAGGLETYIELLKSIPARLGISIVIVNHMTDQPTRLHEILPKYTSLSVKLITQSLRITPNCVFVIPSNSDLQILNGHFRLRPRSKVGGWSNVITLFLFSLAQYWEGLLMVIIVSGLDGDGADALGEVKKSGGIVMVQTPESAAWSDMPEAAIKTGNVDYVMAIESIALKIVEIVSDQSKSNLSKII